MAPYILLPNGSISKIIKNKDNQNELTLEETNLNKKSDFVHGYLKDTRLNDKILDSNQNNQFQNDKFSEMNSQNLFDVIGSIKPEYNDYVIGRTDNLINTSFGNSVIGEDVSSINYYKPYNSFFDLNLEELVTIDKKEVSGLQIFADELQLNFFGVNDIYIDSDSHLDDITTALLSFVDISIGAIIPITAVTLAQSLLQAAQEGPSDPFGVLPKIDSSDVISNRMGRFISYIKINENTNTVLAVILNPILDALTSFLNTIEKLMNFPKIPIDGGFGGIAKLLYTNIIGFILGYVSYLLPGFKIGKNLASTNNPAIAIASILIDIGISLITVDSSRHNLNMLIRKIITNRYFNEEIIPKAKTTTKNGEKYEYAGQSLIKLSQFFYRFIGQRIAAGEKQLKILENENKSKINRPFSIQKIKELPIEKESVENSIGPIPIGPNILSNENNSDDTTKQIKNSLNKSIYSFGTVIQNGAKNSNSFFKYYNKLIEQNMKMSGEATGKYIKRLDKEHVKEIEKIIDSDYMPLSIQDLRTNEVFKFHAFVESFQDQFTINWEDAGAGFGRMDPIKIYKSTIRSVTVDFWLIAMGKDDFDTMWWMINRLLNLIYPQWTKATPAFVENQKEAGVNFGQAFTQLPATSPLIRLRLGDLFTSNYSKKNMARIFGFDESLKSISKENSTKISFSRLQSLFNESKENNNLYELIGWMTFNNAEDPLEFDRYEFSTQNKKFNILKVDLQNNNDYLKYNKQPKYNSMYFSDSDIKLKDFLLNTKDYDNVQESAPTKKDYYLINYISLNIAPEENGDNVLILAYLNKNDDALDTSTTGNASKFINKINEEINGITNVADNFKKLNDFMSSTIDNKVNNPIIKAFESTMGEGLAGTINSLSVNFDQNIPWEIDNGSRAPIGVKINIALNVIHDILPGLDHNGLMRAPIYRVGNINRALFGGSVYDELSFNADNDIAFKQKDK
jgi:hypothetical protein